MFNRASPLLVVLLLSCEGEMTAPPVSFSRDIKPLFNGACMTCHWQSPLLFDVTNPTTLANHEVSYLHARNTKMIVPGKPEESFLYTKLAATDLDLKEEGMSMPASYPEVTDTERETIRRWIANGADAGDPDYLSGTTPAERLTKVKYIFGFPNTLTVAVGKCAICHAPGTPFPPDLTNPFDPVHGAVNVTASNGMTIIIPGDPENSLLVQKISHPVPAGAGRAMPLVAPRLTDQQLELVHRWILEGAQDN